jgi:MFS family permease
MARSTAVALLLTVVGGLAAAYVTVHITTLVQVTTPNEIRGRVVGLLTALSTALTPVAAGLAGVTADLLDQNIRLLYAGCGAILAAIALILSTNREYRAIIATDFEQARAAAARRRGARPAGEPAERPDPAGMPPA